MSALSSVDSATPAATTLAHALENPAPTAPFTKLDDKQLEAIKQLSGILTTATQQSKTRKLTHFRG